MTQGFVFGTPPTRSALISAFVAGNFDAIGSMNEGSNPPENPREGMPWLDTSDAPTQFRLNLYLSGAFQPIAVFPVVLSDTTSFRALFGVPSVTWTISHNFSKPNVDVSLFDVLGKKIEALEIDVSDFNEAVVTHAYPAIGAALAFG